MARVFEARRESLAGVHPRVAIKVILPNFADNRPFQDLFVHEARIGSMLQHQNVVQIQDFDCQDGLYYLVDTRDGERFVAPLALGQHDPDPAWNPGPPLPAVVKVP